MARLWVCLVLAGCGASASSTTAPRSTEPRVATASEERARREQLGARHRALLDQQATALAATCAKPAAHAVQRRCTPTCYVPEAADARAGKKLTGSVEIMHLACTRGDDGEGPFLIVDELAGAKLDVRVTRGKLPTAGKKGTWQGAVEAAVTSALQPELARGDVVRVSGTWSPVTHPITKEPLRCVPVAHYAKALRHALDACGAQGSVACEATGNAAVHGINVVHYRLAEARQHQAAGRATQCQQAALEAIAVARGMPRWRQYMTLNTDRWKPSPRYRTRFDGTLDEDALFSSAIKLGTEAEDVLVACGGPAQPRTAVADEQSFHICDAGKRDR